MKKGFSLIELIVAVFLASLVSLSLFQLLSLTRKSVRRMTNVMATDIPFIAFYNQMEKDVMGMFAPASSVAAFIEKLKQPEKEKAGKEDKEGKEKEKSEKAKKKEQPKGEKPIERIFAVEGKNETFFLSFVTTGALTVLESDGSLKAMPSLRRVAYLLQPDPQRPGTLRLMYRFNDKDFAVDALKSPSFTPSYELITGIKQFEIECTLFEFVEKAEEGKKTDAKEKQPAKKPTKTVLKEWNEAEIWDKYKSLIPAYVKIKGTLVNFIGNEYPFEFLFKVYAYNPYKPQPKSLYEKLEEIARSIWKQ